MRALLSVYDKTGLEAFARGLVAIGFELVCSGQTAGTLGSAGIPHRRVDDVTGAPELLDGRVKTLHPVIHAGILADRSNPAHVEQLEAQDITPIDLVVCNLYPFRTDPGIELIDIGGPTMVRAAAKNHANVGVVVDPADYGPVLDELRREGELSPATRRRLARAAFAHTAAYDAAITSWFDDVDGEMLPPTMHIALERAEEPLRYGENPHQRAARYRNTGRSSFWDGVTQHAGMTLSYLNVYDTEAAWLLAHDLGDTPACVIVKHANPCGAAVAADPVTAYRLALECDPKSAFGGIVAFNRPLTAEVADAMADGPQADVVIAPGWQDSAVERLVKKRKNTRLLESAAPPVSTLQLRQILDGFLVQEAHRFDTGRGDWEVVTKASPTDEQWRDAELAWRICGHVKSNAIVLVAGGQAVGIGAGQQSRVDAAEIAARKAGGRAAGGASASDAFYPFPDGVEAAAAAGVAVVIQPGGSLRDDDIIRTADELGLAMVLTGERHFFH